MHQSSTLASLATPQGNAASCPACRNDAPRVAVIFGGASPEYAVSLQSAAAVIRSLEKHYPLLLLGIDPEGRWYHYVGPSEEIADDRWRQDSRRLFPAYLSPDREIHGLLEQTPQGWRKQRIEIAFPVLHGEGGEDGCLQGLLRLAGIPFVGCDVLSSALCIDKYLAHQLVAAAGIRVPAGVLLERQQPDTAKERCRALRYPLFVKPLRAGSSFGISRITEESQLAEALALAWQYDVCAIVEEAIAGTEIGCAILGDSLTTQPLFLGKLDEVELQGDFFDYTEKYQLITAKLHLPARIDSPTARRLQEQAQTIYRILRCQGLARVDLFLTPAGEIYFNEVNTLPGFTNHSRYPAMMQAAGLDFDQLIQKLLQEAYTCPR